ncbi:ABC transporter permease [Paenalkalicoccus suaedae]|uniref:ABC transporter permease n=1 Tax=Paenalkalicoccus suaedae TaxID=2592382 RepID=A0A859FCU2_9BACI|nr:ABC transporter permease [Paenalkalicoccus suaedae]QKS70075.1 ABC transporter permease [Paenalkalicoccus suaedae]
MTLSMKRIYAIFQKDVKDVFKNMFVLSTLFMPIILAVFYSSADIISQEISLLLINLTFVAVATFIQAAIIAEEKEKSTLRGLMMSPASVGDILIGKSIVSVVLTVITLLLISWISGFELGNTVYTITGLIVALAIYIVIGTLLGLLSRSVMEASVISLPLILILGMGSMFVAMFDDIPFIDIIMYLPNFQLDKIVMEASMQASLINVAWLVVLTAATVIVYQKRTID